MSDASTNSSPTVDVPVEGGKVTLAKLSAADRTKLLRKAKLDARNALKANLTESGLDAEKAYIEYRQFDDMVWGANRWLWMASNFEGQEEILRAALIKGNPGLTPDLISAELEKLVSSHDDATKIVCQVIALPFQEPTPKVPNMRAVGMYEGHPLYVATGEVDGSQNPTEAKATEKTAERPKAYGQ